MPWIAFHCKKKILLPCLSVLPSFIPPVQLDHMPVATISLVYRRFPVLPDSFCKGDWFNSGIERLSRSRCSFFSLPYSDVEAPSFVAGSKICVKTSQCNCIIFDVGQDGKKNERSYPFMLFTDYGERKFLIFEKISNLKFLYHADKFLAQ